MRTASVSSSARASSRRRYSGSVTEECRNTGSLITVRTWSGSLSANSSSLSRSRRMRARTWSAGASAYTRRTAMSRTVAALPLARRNSGIRQPAADPSLATFDDFLRTYLRSPLSTGPGQRQQCRPAFQPWSVTCLEQSINEVEAVRVAMFEPSC